MNILCDTLWEAAHALGGAYLEAKRIAEAVEDGKATTEDRARFKVSITERAKKAVDLLEKTL